ncbi:MAG: hypothetical protein M1281_11160 [Chloroflexi bacterium]|nr:hypothetical protein [Chloroflexota bacterium]
MAFLQDALKQGVLPLHISDPLTLGGVSDCFLSIPDQILSPQILLLLFMSIGKFVLVDVLLLYTVGFLGLLWFRRKYSLSWFSFTLLFGLFNFNGQILGHLSIGHLTWGGYFLFPWFAALVISFIEGDHSWKWIAKMSLLLLAILLQGAYHQYVWTLIFLFFLAFANRRYILPIAGTLGLSILVNAFRILPPFLLLGSFNNAYVGGYLTFTDIWKAMIERMQPGSVIITSLNAQPVKAWEVTLFVGLAGAIFMVIFGLYRWLRGREGKILYWELILPLTGLFLFSFDRIYRYVRYLPLPILSGERVADRFLTLPFFFIMILAAIELQRWLNQPHRNQVILRIGAIGLFLAGSQDLWLNLKSWTPRSVSNHMPSFAFKLENWFVVNHADPSYTTILIVGALISLISISFVLFMALRKQKNIPPTGAS